MALIPAPRVIGSFDEVLPILRNRGFWAGLVALGLILGVAGPYGTVETVPLGLRLVYWLAVTLMTGTFGFVLGFIGCDLLFALGLPKLLAGPLSGAITGLPVSGIVFALTALLLEPGALAKDGATLVLSVIAISTIISLATTVAFFIPPSEKAPSPLPPFTRDPRLFARLPDDLRAPLIALSAIDHYTAVTTTAGTTRLLLRLSDAMAESAPTPGLQIHRSHWVAFDHITATRRDGPRAIVTLSNGSERPVSRSYVASLAQAGLLPAR